MSRWPGLAWPVAEAAIRTKLTDRFTRKQQLPILVEPRGRSGAVYVAIGVVSEGAEAAAYVDVGTYPSQGDLQRDIIRLADEAPFSAEWQRVFGSWGGVRSSSRLVVLGDHRSAEQWFLDRLQDLSDAGVLARSSPFDGPKVTSQSRSLRSFLSLAFINVDRVQPHQVRQFK